MLIQGKYIEYSSLQSVYGVAKDTINTGLKRSRQGGSQSWQSVPDPKDKRRVLIEYNSIPESTKKKYNLPTQTVLKEEKVITECSKKQEERQKQVEAAKKVLIKALEEDYVRHCPKFVDLKDRDKIRKAAKKYAVLEVIDALSESVSLKVIFEAYKMCDQEICNISEYTSFVRKLSTFRKDKEKSVIHGNTGKANARKTNKIHKYFSELYAADPHKPSQETICKLVNEHAKEYGFKEISLAWIKTYLARPEVNNSLMLFREGENYFNTKVCAYTDRQPPKYPGDIWEIDGSPIPFFCRMQCTDKDGKRKTTVERLNLFVVLDVFTRKIMGFDIALTEDRHNVLNALRRAITLHGLPVEIIHDNFSSHKTEEFRDLKNALEMMGTNFRAHKVGNPRDKSHVERWFGTFHTEFCREYDDYIGEGIKSKRKNARPAPEFYAAAIKEEGLVDADTMKVRIATIIDEYNSKPRSVIGRQAPHDCYQDNPKSNVRQIQPWQTMLLFGTATTTTVKNCKVKITVRHQEYSYNLPSNDLRLKLNGSEVTVRYQVNDLSTIYLFNTHNTLICQCELQPAIHQQPQTKEEVKVLQKQAAVNASFKHAVKARAVKLREEAEAILNEKEEIALRFPSFARKEHIESAEKKYFLEDEGINVREIKERKPIKFKTPYTDTDDDYEDKTTKRPAGVYYKEGTLIVREKPKPKTDGRPPSA